MDAQKSGPPRTLGVTWGGPESVATYSGVPHHLFAELRREGVLVGTADAKLVRPWDLALGALDWRRTLHARRPRRSALWRYLPENIDRLSARLRQIEARLPEHDAVLQFGVAGLPAPDKALVAHVEISVETAISSPVFSRSFGFDGFADATVRRAIDGERMFLERCARVWTNTQWTAEGLAREGVAREKIRVQPPGCGLADPGTIRRDWSRCNLLFVGRTWQNKGGDLLLEAFRLLRRSHGDATLTIVGVRPPIDEPGVRVLGLLRKDQPVEARALRQAFEEATVYCMPSYWESTGIVYMEAALYGLPVVMLAGQGREAIFPDSMALHVAGVEPERLAQALTDLASSPETMERMGREGREHVLEHYTWPVVARRVTDFIAEATAVARNSAEAEPGSDLRACADSRAPRVGR